MSLSCIHILILNVTQSSPWLKLADKHPAVSQYSHLPAGVCVLQEGGRASAVLGCGVVAALAGLLTGTASAHEVSNVAHLVDNGIARLG